MRPSRKNLALLFVVLSVVAATHAQSGPCTESVVKQGKLASSQSVFVYMPPYGKPVAGKSAIEAANEKTNITRSWEANQRNDFPSQWERR